MMLKHAPRARSLGFLLWRRSCSTEIDASALRIIEADHLQDVPDTPTAFGTTFTDYMLEIDWTKKNGWEAPVIKPLAPIALHPACSSLHYGIQCFEGMKAYKGKNGELRLFRPMMNLNRFQVSMKRVQLPAFDKDELLKCMEEFVKLEARWVPANRDESLYLRPTAISTQPTLGVATPYAAKIYLIASQVGAYFPEGFQAVSLLADRINVRAWPGGTGGHKIGGNYAPTIAPLKTANQAGYSQVLWLYNDTVTEVGTMNLMCYWVNEDGEEELVTAPLDGTILPGVTRDTIIKLTRSWGIKVVERTYSMPELAKAVKENRVIEMFGCGTACVVCPIKGIRYENEDLNIPVGEAGVGELTRKIWGDLLDIQTGAVEHEYSHVIEGTGNI